MKKTFITVLSIFLSAIAVVHAQSLQDGINDVYAERYLGAKATFEKLLASNPNNIEATYWLGQAYIGMDDINGAKTTYEKGLASSSNAPLLQVGMGEVELIENKINEARQHFETAITMTGNRRGNDPEILNAVGRSIANVYTDKEKKGDINYAIAKLEEASKAKIKDARLRAEIYLNLGNAYRKARPGENGGLAYRNYQNAIGEDPEFALPYYQLARLFNTQHNWDLYERYLTDAISKDPSFAPAYYDLAYFKMGKLDLPAAEDYAKKFAANTDKDPQNEYLTASILWAQKKYDDAITLAKSIISRLGERVKPRVYKLIAYSYLDKGDSLTAKQYVDDYFSKVKPEDIEVKDYKLKADIYSAIPGQEEVVLNSYKDGVMADTTMDNKIQIIKDGIAFFNKRKQYEQESKLQQLLLDTKPQADQTINDLFGAGLAYYRAEEYIPSYQVWTKVADQYPDQQFGWEWKFNLAQLIDTVKKDSIAVPDAINLLAFTKDDTVKFSSQITRASYFLAIYYNQSGERDSAIKYLEMMRSASSDPAQRKSIQDNIDALKAAQQQNQNKPSASASGAAKEATRKTGG